MSEVAGTVIKKRFIAGAVCPKCRAEDRLLVEWLAPAADVDPAARDGAANADALIKRRRCVACGFTELEAAEAAPAALATLPRIRLGAQSLDVSESPVRILDPAQLKPRGEKEPPSES